MSLEIELADVAKHYNGVKAVDGVSMSVPAGVLAGLMGPNGAGKSTLFNLITRVSDLTRGSVRIGQHKVSEVSVDAFSRLPIGRTFQTPRCFTSLTVAENVALMLPNPRSTLLGALFRRESDPSRQRVDELLDQVGLARRRNDVALGLSGGERRMLELARQLARDPQVLLLDEPTAGLDSVFQARLRQLLLDLNAAGVTILVVEHNVRFLLTTSTRVYVMTQGKLIAQGSPDEVAANQRVIEAYLGRDSVHAARD